MVPETVYLFQCVLFVGQNLLIGIYYQCPDNQLSLLSIVSLGKLPNKKLNYPQAKGYP